MFHSDLASAFNDIVVLVSCCLLLGSAPVEGVDVLMVPELLVIEQDPGCDDCDDENST